MSKEVSFSYTLNPPAGITVQDASLSSTKSFPISSPSSSATASASAPSSQPRSATETYTYYTAASSALRAAQTALNESLTVWKDAIGDREKHKEDAGKVAFGRGKAQRMMAANRAAEAGEPASAEDSEDEDGVEDEE